MKKCFSITAVFLLMACLFVHLPTTVFAAPSEAVESVESYDELPVSSEDAVSDIVSSDDVSSDDVTSITVKGGDTPMPVWAVLIVIAAFVGSAAVVVVETRRKK